MSAYAVTGSDAISVYVCTASDAISVYVCTASDAAVTAATGGDEANG